MPYIKQEYRELYDNKIDGLVNDLKDIIPSKVSGHLNYCITKLLMKTVKPIGYDEYNRIVGILECVKQEIYHKTILPYERKKEEENGDVF